MGGLITKTKLQYRINDNKLTLPLVLSPIGDTKVAGRWKFSLIYGQTCSKVVLLVADIWRETFKLCPLIQVKYIEKPRERSG